MKRPRAVFPLLAALAVSGATAGLHAAGKPEAALDWGAYEGGPESLHYSAAKQITPVRVSELTVAWTYPAGDNPVTFNPLVVGSVAYVLTGDGSIAALDAATGRELWRREQVANVFRNRGFAFWQSEDGRDRRLFFNNNDRLFAVDAEDGKTVGAFGTNGSIDLREGLGRDTSRISMIASGTPGRVFGNLIVLGSSTGEEYDSPPGDIRAYDVRSGLPVWTFHTIPHEGEFGSDTWPKDAWKRGAGADNWGGISVDAKRGIFYIVTASAKYNFWGGNRHGSNLFANSIVAIEARTGKRLWHFQMVHHDLWDYDNTASPVLMTVRHKNKPTDIVAVAGKTGFLYVFDRVSGQPLWPIEERPVPASDVPGERASSTQPFPTKPGPFSKQTFSVDDIDPNLPEEERREIIARVKAARTGPIFTPPGTVETVMMPGHRGGANWGMAAGEPSSGRMYVSSFDFPIITRLEFGKEQSVLIGATPYEGGSHLYKFFCESCHGTDLQGRPPSIPSLVGITERLTPEQIITIVQNGRPPMPAFNNIRGEMTGDLFAFLAGDKQAQSRMIQGLEPAGAVSRNAKAPPEWRSDYGFWFTRAGNPVVRPPWSWLTAYDLNTGDIRWRIPIGEDPEYNKRGIFGTGQILVQPGIAVTGGGLIFAATHRDRTLWAIDSRDGRTVSKFVLPAPPLGIPSVYEVNGRQFVLVPATGSGNLLLRGQKQVAGGSNAYVAFALPAKP